ncbi:MAG TPA: TetR/AcrR family transcriptional regulator [Pseudonocardiaceae bacterium]|jgi:AcrR family transcriptional regulator|nr:TetR/AcrR family transcriptional regulator [Pseudonocardiaceae bacterium]
MDSRSKLLAAAAEEFALHGPRGARIQAVVARAGVNERMIYHHFGSKDGLYRAVLEDQIGDFGREWSARLDQLADLPPKEGMRAAFRSFAEGLTARPLLGPLLMHEGLGGWRVRPRLTAERLPEQLRRMYRRGQAEGIFRAAVDFEVVYAVALVSLATAPVFRGLLDDHPHVLDQTIELLLDGLTGPVPAEPDEGER